jgi:hypothetical protein
MFNNSSYFEIKKSYLTLTQTTIYLHTRLAATLLPIGSGGRVSYTKPPPQPARIIEKRLPPPTPQDRAELIRTGTRPK